MEGNIHTSSGDRLRCGQHGGPLFLPNIKCLLEMYWTLHLLIFPFYFLHGFWHALVYHFTLFYDNFTVGLRVRGGKCLSLV